MVFTALALLGACTEKELILPGERVGVREALAGVSGEADAPLAARSAPAVVLPAARNVTDWPQLNATAENLSPHAALGSSLTQIWAADIGAGNTRRNRITAAPVVVGGRVFAMDAQATVTAISISGARLWATDLTPALERGKEASGGGLAHGEGKLFVSTGFGALVALDPATGREIWRQRTGAAVTGAPTYRDGLVYVVSRDNTAWAIRAGDGRIQWQLPGAPSPSGVIGGAAPAISDRLAVFPFGSAELAATLRQSGVRVWAATISGQRRGTVYAKVMDITADPVIDGQVIYTGTQSGRVVALRANSGERIWTAEEGALGPVLPVGGAVYLISDQARLVRLDAQTGAIVWAKEMPYYTKERVRRRKAVYPHYGPVLAGGRLVVASGDGVIRSFSPQSGALLSTVDLPGGAASRPVVAGRILYVVTAKGQLLAFR
nr:PQQ-like beta-propeller repeat protein [Rhodovulum imhoffii]